MRILTRSVVILVLLWLVFVLFHETQAVRSAENVDGTKVMVLFLCIVFLALVIGAIVAVTIVPAIGESVGSFFFNPDQEIEKSPYADAMVKIAQGDYEGAIEEYKEAYKANPEDTHAVSEIVHLYCDKLGDPDSAQKFLEEALENEWPPEQSAFLGSRLVDVYWIHKHDAQSAKHVLQQIAETMPDTKHAANAYHRLHEIDRALAEEEVNLHLHSKPVEEPPPASEAAE